MPKLHITQEFIKKVKPPISKSKIQYFCSELNGFMCEVKNTGVKTYYYRYRLDKKQKMIKIASVEDTPLESAKRKYYELKEQITTLQSQQTTQALYASQEEELNPITFQEFYDTHYLAHIQINVKSYETNISIFKNHILPHLATTKMIDLKKNQVMQYHSSMVKDKNLAPATANKFLIFLSNAYKLSHDFELLPHDINPCRGIKEFELNNQRQVR